MKTRMRFLLTQRSNRRRFGAAVRVTACVAAFAAVFVALTHLPLISVRSVEIDPESEGTEILHAEVLAHTRALLGEYRYGIKNSVRYLFRPGIVEDGIREKFLHTDVVTISTHFFNRWSILLRKRETFGTYCAESACFLIDMNGLVFAKTDTVKPGRVVEISGDIAIGDYLFADGSADGTGALNFMKLERILTYMEDRGIFVRAVAVRRGSHDVHITAENGPGVWINMNESIYDITRALHITFFEVFPGREERKSVSSLIICDPLNPHWKSGRPWDRGCKDLRKDTE